MSDDMKVRLENPFALRRAAQSRGAVWFFALILVLALAPAPALAYVGPGLGLSAIGAVIAVIGAFLLAIFSVVFFPIRRALRNRKSAKAAKADGDSSKEASESVD